MYAIIRTGGKQYRVEVGQRLRTERLPGADGDIVEFTHVLLIENDGDTTIGTPLISGASVEAEIVSQSRKKAIPVFKYKNKHLPKIKKKKLLTNLNKYWTLKFAQRTFLLN